MEGTGEFPGAPSHEVQTGHVVGLDAVWRGCHDGQRGERGPEIAQVLLLIEHGIAKPRSGSEAPRHRRASPSLPRRERRRTSRLVRTGVALGST